MIYFVNAKLNLGLNIVRRRPDGYHDLETVFIPVGLSNGLPGNPTPFCDILEVTEAGVDEYLFEGKGIECAPADNLVCRAVEFFRNATGNTVPVRIMLEKHLPQGAGLGGGSADASFTLRALNELCGKPLDRAGLERLALKLGADCPVFIRNVAVYAEGVGEEFYDIENPLAGMWAVIVKPDVFVSTREAFAGVKPHESDIDLREAVKRPISEWKGLITNDFEASVFPQHPVLADIKEAFYARGAEYASMSGSGSSLYGIYSSREDAEAAFEAFSREYEEVYISLL